MVRQITRPHSSTLLLWEQGYLAGINDAGMSINQIREATDIQDFRCILFLFLLLRLPEMLFLVVWWGTSLLPKRVRVILTPRGMICCNHAFSCHIFLIFLIALEL